MVVLTCTNHILEPVLISTFGCNKVVKLNLIWINIDKHYREVYVLRFILIVFIVFGTWITIMGLY